MANIGIGILGGQKIDLQKSLNEYILSVAEDYEIKSTFRACVPIASPLKKLVEKNVMVVGDAARLALPLMGGGIGNALYSGELAGTIAAKYIRKEASLEKYQDLMKEKIDLLQKSYKKEIMMDESKFIKSLKRTFSMEFFLIK